VPEFALSGTQHSGLNLFVNSWQGSIVVARAGGGLEHFRKVFRDLKEMVDLS